MAVMSESKRVLPVPEVFVREKVSFLALRKKFFSLSFFTCSGRHIVPLVEVALSFLHQTRDFLMNGLFFAIPSKIYQQENTKAKRTVLYLEVSVLLEALLNSVNPKLPISVKSL